MTDPRGRSGDRSHEVGYEDLGFEDWHMLTGLPPAAYEEWKGLGIQERRDVVGMFQEPETMEDLCSFWDGED